jgi:t-SNARE complex subunit (syntaxin)
MSFQDVGKPGGGGYGGRRYNASGSTTMGKSSNYRIPSQQQQQYGRRINSNNNNNISSMNQNSATSNATYNSNINANVSAENSSNNGYAQVSDGILQYRRNVGILEKISQSIGTSSTAESTVSETQYRVQVDVVQQLGNKIEQLLQNEQIKMNSMPRDDAARLRATHIKLTRDYRRVEANFKTIHMETKKRQHQHNLTTQKSQQHFLNSNNSNVPESHSFQLQQQLQEDRINEEIMREREEEIRNINKGMHQVNEIYKDLAHIVASQQEQIDEVETHMEDANTNAENGLKQIEKASAKAESSQCIIS